MPHQTSPMPGAPGVFADLVPHLGAMLIPHADAVRTFVRPVMDTRSRVVLAESGASLESPLADWPQERGSR